ncbi:MAG: glutathione S-transferase family protein [Pseudomonadales bacterium]
MPIKTFYSSDFPPNALRVNHMLKLKGVELDYVDINMMKGDQFTPEYTAVNPSQTVPAILLEDGTVLSEVVAMLYYLDNEYPQRPLMGRTPVERAQILGWLHKLFMTGLLSIAEILRNGLAPGFEDRALPGPLNIKQIPELTERGQKKLAFFFDTMEAELSDKEFLVGDELSQADVDLFICTNFSAAVKQKPDAEKHSSLLAHKSRVAALLEQA